MARTFRTRSVADVDLKQIIVTDTVDDLGQPEIRIRANVAVAIENTLDPTEIFNINIGVNEPLSTFPGMGQHLLAIKRDLLQFIRSKA